MYIEPNTKIRLIKNCPLDKSQENTIYFTSQAAQTTYFTSTLSGYLFDKNTYQRVNKGVLRVAMNAEALYNCNYLAFQNYAFGDKWFYAFIDKIEYINNITSEISYTIDVMQTWHFAYDLEQCLVEREHSVTDNIGDNLVPENLATGEYITSNHSRYDDLENLVPVLFCTVDKNYDDVNGTVNQGLFTGLMPIEFDDWEDLVDWIADLDIPKQQAIVSGCYMPSKLVHRPVSPASFQHTIPRITSLMRSDGTAVKNKKCLTYPYNFIYVTNFQGNNAVYKYEYFGTHIVSNVDSIIFRFSGGCNPNPSVFMFPFDYKGGDALLENRDEGMSLSGYPQIAWNIDSFKAWLAQNSSSLAVNGIATAGSLAGYLGAGTAAAIIGAPEVALPAMAIAGAFSLAKSAISGAMASLAPPQSKGSTNGASQFQADNMNFEFMNKHITPEFATIIDDYFTMYGYATNNVKVPNRTARPEWNFVKTIGCKIQGINSGSGGLPADDADAIETIYNRGVRFWTKPAHIGNYTYDNSPSI